MNSPEYRYLFFTKLYLPLLTSLRRYFKYILKLELNQFPKFELHTLSSVIIIHLSEKDESELLNTIFKRSDFRIVTVGFNNKASINLLDFSNLKDNLLWRIKYCELQPLFSKDELVEKIKHLFKGHGEDSLISCLNWVIYYLSNGPKQFLINEISNEELNNDFINPGLSYWVKFIERFNKSSIYLKFLNRTKEVTEIEDKVFLFQSFVKILQSPHIHISFTEKIIFENIALLKFIDDILAHISQELGLGDVPVQGSSNRR